MKHTTPDGALCHNEDIAQTIRGQIYPRPKRPDGYEGNEHWCPECHRKFSVEERRIMDDGPAYPNPKTVWGRNEWITPL